MGTIFAVAFCAPAVAASNVQPDVKLGASYVNEELFGVADDVSDLGWRIDALFNFLWYDERGQFLVRPRYMKAKFNEFEALNRENKSLLVSWQRKYATAETNLRANFSRRDLFSSEFGDINLNSDEELGLGEEDSGIVGLGHRDRLLIAGGFAKNVSMRGAIVFNFEYLDNSYEERGPTTRVDFSQGIAHVGWRWRANERSTLRFLGGARRYEGDNGVQVDSSKIEAKFEMELSRSAKVFAAIGYEELEARQGILNFDSDDSVPFQIGFSKKAQVADYRLNLARFVHPVSNGRFEERTRLAFVAERKLSERFTGAFAIVAFRGEALGDSGSSMDRDQLAGRLELYWAVRSNWNIGVEFSHRRIDSSNSALASETRSRSEVFFNVRYKGLEPRRN